MISYNTYKILKKILSTPTYIEETNFLIEKWSKEITDKNDYSFSEGLVGLGWLLGFLFEKQIIIGDEDEILEDIDDFIYKLCLKEIFDPLASIDRMLEYLTFYHQRIMCSKKEFSDYRNISHYECLKQIISQLNKYLHESLNSSKQIISINNINIILKYSFLIKTGHFEGLIEKPFYAIIEKILEDLSKKTVITTNSIGFLKLMCALTQFENSYWINKLNIYIFDDESQKLDLDYKLWKDALKFLNNEINYHHFLEKQSKDKSAPKVIFEIITNIRLIHKQCC